MKIFLKKSTGEIIKNSSGQGIFVFSELPAEYQKVDYISSNTTVGQYIDTGYIPSYTAGFDIEIKFKPSTASTRYCLLANYNQGNAQLSLELNTSNQFRFWANTGAVDQKVGSVSTSTIKASYHGNTYTINCNGTVSSGTATVSAAPNYTAWLFLDRAKRTGTFTKQLSIYSCKITSGSQIVRNFIPCYRKSDNAIGMYDLVEDKFYTNAGTGTFVKGSNVKRLPSNYLEVEYLQNTGTGYINTGISALNKLFKIDLQFTSNETRQLMGISGSSSAYWGNNKGTWEKVGTTGTGKTTLDRVTICYDVGNITTDRTNTWIEGATNKFTGSDSNWATAAANPLRIFNLAGGSYNCKMKLYEIKVYDNQGHLLNHLIPCIIGGGNDTRGVYDLVLNKFTAATGSLTVGPYV